MSVRDVRNAAQTILADNKITQDELKGLFDSGGGKIDEQELNAMEEVINTAGVDIDDDTMAEATDTIDTIRGLQAEKVETNQLVEAQQQGLRDAMKERFSATSTEGTHSGGTIKPAVKAYLSQAIAAGAMGYDVRKLDDPGRDDHGDFASRGIFSPYPQECTADDTMAFTHTEVTPEKIAEDMSKTQTFWRVTGTETKTLRNGDTYEAATYEKVTEPGSGNIAAHYDEAEHSKRFARGGEGQIWANNYAILDDGSVHCLPAMRRSRAEGALILTNPSLARGQLMLANGHIEMRGGIVTEIGVSGRIQNRVMDGELKLIDPIEILKAQGFNIDPNCTLSWEGGGDQPVKDPATGLYVKP